MKWPYAVAASICAVAIVSSATIAQNAPPPTQQAPSLTQQQLDPLVAPIALYDDALLADVLTASTYPLEVVEAQRWTADPTNAALQGDALTNALAAKDWDPSVKALVPFPEVLQMMDSHLEWTERLGEAFLAQQGDVMDAVQRMRHRAEVQGTLKPSPQQAVASDGDDVTISPPPSDIIYVPTYDPWCAYGAWPYPIYGPYYYSPWVGYCGPDDYGLAFGVGIFLPWGYWDWGYFDWRGHQLRINRGRYDQFRSGHEPAVPSHQGSDVWQHDPTHRAGVPYRDPRNVQQYRPQQNERQSFRGFESGTGAPFESGRATAPAFGDFGSGHDTRIQSQRGQSSRGGISGGAPRGMGGGGRSGGGRGRP